MARKKKAPGAPVTCPGLTGPCPVCKGISVEVTLRAASGPPRDNRGPEEAVPRLAMRFTGKEA